MRVIALLSVALLCGCSPQIAKLPPAPAATEAKIKMLIIPSPNNPANAGVPPYSTPWPRGSDGELLSGTTTLLALIDPSGNIKDIKVELSSGYRSLDTAAWQAVRRWHFSPAHRDGLPIEGYIRIPIAMDGSTKSPPAFYPLKAPSAAWNALTPKKVSGDTQ
jgi:TonB family protein